MCDTTEFRVYCDFIMKFSTVILTQNKFILNPNALEQGDGQMVVVHELREDPWGVVHM